MKADMVKYDVPIKRRREGNCLLRLGLGFQHFIDALKRHHALAGFCQYTAQLADRPGQHPGISGKYNQVAQADIAPLGFYDAHDKRDDNLHKAHRTAERPI